MRLPLPFVLTLVIGAVAWIVGAVLPAHNLSMLPPILDEVGDLYPSMPEGRVRFGRHVYVGLGCQYCHTQQVRPTDLTRGWGARPTLPHDLLADQPPLSGVQRIGPDLCTIGTRQPSREWHYRHLFDPRLTSPGSTMPPHPFLFERTDGTSAAPDAIRPPPDHRDAGTTCVPREEAVALVAYLDSLKRDHPLPGVAGQPALQPLDSQILGFRVYASCRGCHQADGRGVPGAYPPLAGSEWLLGPPEIPACIMLHGLAGELVRGGISYDNAMPGWQALSDERIAAVLTYARSAWGNSGGAIDPSLITAERMSHADRRRPWHSAELAPDATSR